MRAATPRGDEASYPAAAPVRTKTCLAADIPHTTHHIPTAEASLMVYSSATVWEPHMGGDRTVLKQATGLIDTIA